MTFRTPSRALLMSLIAAALVAAPGVEFARSKKPPEAEAPPVALTPAGAVGLPTALLADAAAARAYLQRTTAISAGFTSSGSVQSALRVAAAYEPTALVRGAVAYAAIAALQDPTFVASVRAAGNSPENRATMVNSFITSPAYVFQFKGADMAAGLAKAALGGAAVQLYASGKAVKQSAYDVQHQSWSKSEVPDRPGRLAAAEQSSASSLAPDAEGVPALQRAATGAEKLPITAEPAQPPYTPLVARALQVAAIAALGEGGEDAYQRLAQLSEEGVTHDCLHIAKLNLFQCLAVAKPNYEDIFCLGQHIMMDTGACLAKNAGVEMPVAAVAPPAPAAAPTHAPHAHRRSAKG